MLVPFSSLPESARIWIYQANRPLNEKESEEVKAELEAFLMQWTAHGSDLQAGFDIRYNRFIIIGLDQTHSAASGCSIDASVRFIQALQHKYELDLLDKMNVTFRQGDYISYKPLLEFKKMARQKAISKNTIVFNNLVASKGEFEEHWEVPAEDSWHKRFL